MKREDAKQYIQDHATELLQTDASGKGYICPICGSGSGKNGTGITTKDGTHFTCWRGCYTNADILDIIGLQYGLDTYNSKLEKASEELGITLEKAYTPSTPAEDFPARRKYQKPTKTEQKKEEPEVDYTDLFLQANKDIDKTTYHRGLSLDTLNRFKVGYIEKWRHPKVPETVPYTPRLIIPTSQHSYIARDTRSDLTEQEQQYSKQKVGKGHFLNIEALKTATQPIFIVEGEIDALSIIEVGGDAISLGSVTMVKAFLKRVEEDKPTVSFIIALDEDKAGEQKVAELADGLRELGISHITALKLSQKERLKGCKDANEALLKDREAFKDYIRDQIEIAEDIAEIERQELLDELEKESVAHSIQSFKADIEASKTAEYYPTGFNELDKLLDGGLYPGLYIVGAISSLGKTTFCLQIADQIAQAGTDVLIFSLEMARNELIAKSISRLTYILNGKSKGDTSQAKTTRGILNGSKYDKYSPAETALIDRAIENYSIFARHTYISEGVGNIGIEEIRKRVERHTKITGKAPVVLIDYLQIIAPADIRATDKQNTDKAVLELKRMSRDYSIPIIGISSFNRDNYNSPVNLASFKESGAIEYSCDVLIGLQYEGMDYTTTEESEEKRKKRIRGTINEQTEKAKNGKPQKIQAKILKNRNGSRGDSTMLFYPMFNYFEETIEDFNEEGENWTPWE